jgi:hypothetical protein
VVTRGCEFPNSKRAGRNASEPISSLVNEMEEPTLWSEGEGRWMDTGITEVVSIDSRGSRVGMFFEDLLSSAGDPFTGVGRPPTAAYKETKAQRPETGVGGVHSTV